MKITPQQADALARFLLTIRPDWSKHYTADAVSQMRFISDDLETVVGAAVRGALSPKIAKPDVLAMNGEHWKAPAPGKTSGPIQVQGRCEKCHRLHPPADPCAPPHDVAQAATKRGAAELRELLTQAKASLCPCGVKPQDCADHDPRRQPTEETPDA